jgi:hypothetical protein
VPVTSIVAEPDPEPAAFEHETVTVVGLRVSPAVVSEPPPVETAPERPPPEIEQAALVPVTDQVIRDDVP